MDYSYIVILCRGIYIPSSLYRSVQSSSCMYSHTYILVYCMYSHTYILVYCMYSHTYILVYCMYSHTYIMVYCMYSHTYILVYCMYSHTPPSLQRSALASVASRSSRSLASRGRQSSAQSLQPKMAWEVHTYTHIVNTVACCMVIIVVYIAIVSEFNCRVLPIVWRSTLRLTHTEKQAEKEARETTRL